MNIKTAGVMTMHRIVNYGSALQAYATMKVLNSLGIQCTIIDYLYPTDYHLVSMVTGGRCAGRRWGHWVMERMGRGCFLQTYLSWKRMVKDYAAWKIHRNLARRFTAWRKQHLRLTPLFTRRSLLKRPPLFDLYVTGSDQTFKAVNLGRDHSFLLDFAPSGCRRCAYSASFGVSVFPRDFCDDYSRLLRQYHAISVREESGTAIVSELCGQEARCVVDPTMLLDRGEWLNIAEIPRQKLPARYILCYMLEAVSHPFPRIEPLMKQLCAWTGYELVFVGEVIPPASFSLPYVAMTEANPSEFVYLYEHADFVLTNSFHGTAFSVIMRKAFLSVLPDRAKQADDRIVSLLRRLNLADRTVGIDAVDSFCKTFRKENLPVIFPEQAIDAMRAESMDFIQNRILG